LKDINVNGRIILKMGLQKYRIAGFCGNGSLIRGKSIAALKGRAHMTDTV
jgi:hypothetical protein